VQNAPADQQAAPDKSRRKAIIMVGVALVALAAVIAAITIMSSSTRQLTADQLQPGDCLTGSSLGLGAGGDWPDEVTAVPCTQRHLAEVFFAGNAWPQSLTSYPGFNAAGDQGYSRCLAAFTAYDGIGNSASIFMIDWIVPGYANDWASGDRELVCMAYQQGVPVDYSIKGSAR
jgi:hypothetical protein